MAEKVEVEQKLPDIFKNIWKKYEFVENTEESTSSDKVQGYVYNACESCKAAIEMVNKLGLFSTNEEIEEVATNEIKYMLLPALLGYFTMKTTVRDRLKVVTESQDYYKDYIRMCKNYSVTNVDIVDTPDKELSGEAKVGPPARVGIADIKYQSGSRNSKIQRYKEQKEMEKKLMDLYEAVEKDTVDDEVKRDYYLTLLKRWVNICVDELDSIQCEIGILEMMAARKDKGEKSIKKREPEKKNPPLRPFIITKDSLQKQVYGLGYPSIPTLTIEEFCDQKIEEGHLKDGKIGGHSMQDWAKDPDKDKEQREIEEAEKEEKQEREDPEELQRAREWDEYRDDHRRGWGNRQNMG